MLRFALRNLVSRKARSTLSLLGLTVAILGMVGLFSVAEGLDRMVADTFRRIPGVVAMEPGAPIPLFSRIPAAWRERIAAVEGVRVVNPEVWQRANLIEGRMIISPPRFFFGTEIASRLELRVDPYHQDLAAGRFLRAGDVGTLNCVISRPVADEFQKRVGDTLDVGGGIALDIVGIYDCGSILLDVAIVMDIGEVRRITRFDPDSVSSFYIEPEDGADVDELVSRIEDVFRRAAGAGPPMNSRSDDSESPAHPEPQGSGSRVLERLAHGSAAQPEPVGSDSAELPIEIRSTQQWGQRIEEFAADLDLILAVLTSIGVTIAVLSIVNTMLMSVRERIIEFGILKANGWSQLDVLKLITCESAVLGLGGGVLGSLSGWTATQIINANWPTRIHLYASPGLLGFSVVFATVLGVLGGLYPAVWAMRMMPMDAIRRG